MKKKAIDYKKNKTVRLKEKKMKVELVLRNKKSGRRGAEKIRKILEVKLCVVCYNENEIMGKIKRRKKTHFVYANEKGKAEKHAFKLATWALSILSLSFSFPFFSPSTSLHLALATQ